MKELNIQIPKGYEIDKQKSTFEKIVFKEIKNKLPKTWEEFCGVNFSVINEYYIGGGSDIESFSSSRFRDLNEDRNLLSTEKDAEAHLALIQLHRLRDVYRQGWKPDWSDCTSKWCIYYIENKLDFYRQISINRFLSFQSPEIAKEFLHNFRNLIEKAKDLI